MLVLAELSDNNPDQRPTRSRFSAAWAAAPQGIVLSSSMPSEIRLPIFNGETLRKL